MIKKQKNNAFSFSLRVWFLTLFLGSLLYSIFEIKSFGYDIIGGITILLLLSIPFFFIFLLFNKFIFKVIENKTHIKLVINLFIFFILFNLSWFLSFKVGSIIFCSCLLFISTVLIFQIKIILETKTYHNDIIDHENDLDF